MTTQLNKHYFGINSKIAIIGSPYAIVKTIQLNSLCQKNSLSVFAVYIDSPFD